MEWDRRAVAAAYSAAVAEYATKFGDDLTTNAFDRGLIERVLSCDAVICWFSIHNLPRSLLPTLLTELHRVLRVGGRLLLATHSGTGEEWFGSDADGRVVCTYYGRDELTRLLRNAGFVDVTMHTREPRPHEHQVVKLFALAST